MKKILIAFALVFWFYSFNIPEGNHSGIALTTFVGKFESRDACESHRDDMQEVLDTIGVKASSCRESGQEV